MSLVGYLILVSGWLLVIAALLRLAGMGSRLVFVIAALFVELLGLALLAQHHRLQQKAAP